MHYANWGGGTHNYEALIPALTSQTAEVIESSHYSSYQGFCAFKRNIATDSIWQVTNSDVNPYIGYKFSTPQTVKRLFLCARPRLNKFKIQYSNDGTTWNDLGNEYDFYNQDLAQLFYQIYDNINPNNISATQWRLLFTEMITSSGGGVAKMQLYKEV